VTDEISIGDYVLSEEAGGAGVSPMRRSACYPVLWQSDLGDQRIFFRRAA